MPVFYDLATEYAGGHRVLLVDGEGRVVETAEHRPWFLVYGERRPPRIKGVAEIEETGYTPLIYNPAAMAYVARPGWRAWRVYTVNKSLVPRLAAKYALMGFKCGLFNIIYEARVSLDYTTDRGYRLFGAPSPAVFLPNDEMVSVVEELVDRVSKLRVIVFDIEVLSSTGGFPARGDPILSIAFAEFELGDTSVYDESAADRVEVLYAEKPSEEESRALVEKFLDRVLSSTALYVVGYNSSAFDIPYMEPFSPIPLHPYRVQRGDRLKPHIDLALLRDSLGASLGIRSHAAWSLDEVAAEVVKSMVAPVAPDAAWILSSRFMEAERLLNHARLREYWERRDPLLHDYIVADVLLTMILARTWLPVVAIISVLTGIAPSILQRLSTGQIMEYVKVEWLRRLGFAPELRSRRFEYRKVKPGDIAGLASREWARVFTSGKVYTRGFGVYGGASKVYEGDYAQLYPSDMVANAVDPTAIHVVSVRTPSGSTKLKMPEGAAITRKTVEVVLGRRDKKSSDTMKPYVVADLVPGYGPLSFLHYKLYTARRLTKKFKKMAKSTGRPEYMAVDMAVKILNNSAYGDYGKERGNLVSEVVAASVFWRTERINLETIELVEKLSGGRGVVLYADTDSVFVLFDGSRSEFEDVLKRVTSEIQSRYGPFYEIEFEDEFDFCIYPRKKDRPEPSGKSYICFKGGKPAVIKGEFFKVVAPLGVKERLAEFYERVVREARTRADVARILVEMLRGEPLYKWFVKKSVSSLVNEDDPRKVKRLNRDFHYAALYTLAVQGSPAARVLRVSEGRVRRLRIAVDARRFEEEQRVVIVHYLPGQTPRNFILYVGDDGENAVIHNVVLESLRVVAEPAGGDEERFELGYVAEFTVREERVDRARLAKLVVDSMQKYIIDDVARKLLPALSAVYPTARSATRANILGYIGSQGGDTAAGGHRDSPAGPADGEAAAHSVQGG